MYEIQYGFKEKWINRIMEIHNSTELKRKDTNKTLRALKNSFCVVICLHNKDLIGVGRMISDGEMYSAIFDVVIDPAHQKKGIGKKIVRALIEKAPNTCCLLYTSDAADE